MENRIGDIHYAICAWMRYYRLKNTFMLCAESGAMKDARAARLRDGECALRVLLAARYARSSEREAARLRYAYVGADVLRAMLTLRRILRMPMLRACLPSAKLIIMRVCFTTCARHAYAIASV